MAPVGNFMDDHLFGGAPLWLWLLFHALVFGLLIVDWAVTRTAREEPVLVRRANWMTAVWIAAALLFAFVVYRVLSQRYALEYLAGYGIEESLSIDNLFVFLVLFQAFGLKLTQQRRVLFFGVLGAIVMRAAMIFAGIRSAEYFLLDELPLRRNSPLHRISPAAKIPSVPTGTSPVLDGLALPASAHGPGKTSVSVLRTGGRPSALYPFVHCVAGH